MGKTRYLVPNLFTSLSFLLGTWAICFASGALTLDFNSPVIFSAHLIIFSVLLDKLDGTAARIMNASSDFGAQFDSLADLIAFGLAPAFAVFFAYQSFAPLWFLKHKTMLLAALSVYVLCAALRLAKYNAMDADSHPDYFVGMPSTLSGAFNALLLIIFYKHGLFVEGNPYVYIPAVMLITTALLMVSPLFLAKLKMRKSKFINFVQIISVATGYVFGFAMIFEEYLISLITIYSVVGFGYGILNRDQILNHDKVPQA